MSSTNQSLKRLKTGRFVSNSHVNMLRRNYEAKRWVENSKRIGKPDSRGVWYSLADLRYFLDTAEKSGADGVALYFGVYSSSFPEDVLKEDRQTVVLVATKQEINAKGKTENRDLSVSGPEGPQMIAFNMGASPKPWNPVPQGDQESTFITFPFLKLEQNSI